MALNIPLNELSGRQQELTAEEPLYVHCGSGYRSTIATSLLKSRGYDNVVNVQDNVGLILDQEIEACEIKRP